MNRIGMNFVVRSVFALALLTNCSSQSSNKTNNPAPANNTQTNNQGNTCKANSLANTAIGSDAGSTGNFNANSIAIFDQTEKQRRSLCDLLLSSGKKVAVFQFAGVVCSSCQVQARNVDSGLQSSPNSNNIAFFIVFTDYPEDRPATYLNRFISTYSPHALTSFDDQQQVWKFLSPARSFGTTLVLDTQGRSQLIVQEGQEASILNAANQYASGQ